MNDIYLSITEVNRYIKTIFDKDSFLSNVYIKGEISNLKSHSRGHLYFSLKDETSKINAVMFSYNNSKLNFIPVDGMNVQIRGKINVYEASGSYQVYVEEMTEDGVGNLYVLFEELKRNLSLEGLFDKDHKKPLPRLPKKIGVITADTGAAVRDIISTINRRYPRVEIILFPSLVQGEGAKENLVKMINLANTTDVEVIILGRGGGSIEDLWAFNEEIVARAIYNSKIPIVSSVGHEIDFTISDFVADLRAPTPTAAAELVVPDQNEILRYLSDYKNRLYQVIINKLNNYQEQTNKYETNYILKNPINIYEIKEQKLDNYIEKLDYIMTHKLDKTQDFLKTIKMKLDLLNPTNILNKGYSIVEYNGIIIKDTKNINVGNKLNIILNKGKIISEVKEVK